MIHFLLSGTVCNAQEAVTDTVKPLSEVVVQAFGQKQNLTTALVSVIEYMPRSGKTSLVSDFNTIPGVRMEERSPGSYRINVRGSSLRSPFGVRNVKVYWNNIPLTDPGGNTYFNQLAFNNFSSMEVFKGPASSMYGAGTGGLILIDNDILQQNNASLEYITGSYGLRSVLTSRNLSTETFSTKVTYAHNESDGYRVQSAMRRDNLSWISKLKLTKKQELSAALLYTNMYYQTPGALTLQEYINNPRSARPSAGIFPSAQDAKAAIWQKNLTAGLTYKNRFMSNISNTTMLYGSYNHIRNSAVRNYETRIEPHFGGRTQFAFNKKFENGSHISWDAGLELQGGNFNVKVNGNNKGIPDTLQTNDDVHTVTYSLFTQATYTTAKNWIYTAGISYNKNRLGFTRLNDYPVLKQPFVFNNELAPRISVSKKFQNKLTFLGSVSKGYSPPTVAELLPSTGIINMSLKAEEGWNYELTAEKQLFDRLRLQATGFYFDMKNALVQQRDETGADYFTNAGSIQQRGIELFADYGFQPWWMQWLTYGYIKTSYTFNHFRYITFLKDGNDFSGRYIPGVPQSIFSLVADVYFKNNLYISTTYYGASRIFLNDANTEAALPYHLLGIKAGYKIAFNKFRLNLYAGADNLFNETYSLGNDINAIGSRYYNAAPRRNMYAGAAISYKK